MIKYPFIISVHKINPKYSMVMMTGAAYDP